MVRQKVDPKKRQRDTDKVSLNDNGFIPVFKKRRTKRKPLLNPSFSVNLPAIDNNFYLGELLLGKTNNVFPESYKECKVEFSVKNSEDEQESCILNLDQVCVVIRLTIDAEFLKEIITTKVFAIDFKSAQDEIYMHLHFSTLPLEKFNKKVSNCIKTLFSLLYDISEEKTNELNWEKCNKNLCGNSEITNLYEKIYVIRARELSLDKFDVQHTSLRPQLRPYQVDAVRWMIRREQQDLPPDDQLHPLYNIVILKSGLEIYYDKFSGNVDLKKPEIPRTSQGGILADEMGLGKTVEVLACILLNKKPTDEKTDSNRIIDDSSDSSSDESVATLAKRLKDTFDEESKPVIEEQCKKQPRYTEQSTSSLVDQPRDIKVPKDWVKGSSKKSANYIALKMLYENSLYEFSALRKPREKLLSVQCICGSTDTKNVVTCDKCKKMQHPECLGYKKHFGKFKCPQCWMDEPLIESRATLIVTPLALRTQWCKEIEKHIKGKFKVLKYKGSGATPVYPTQMKSYDLVITTYNVLQAELKLTENNQSLSLRNQKKYSPPGTPLTRVKWWRLCLDEAQTVETPGRIVSMMARKLTANIRWAVTGTPISKEISDLFGLIDYLQITPYNDLATWTHLLYQPYAKGNFTPMCEFLSQVLWRTSKSNVLDQINIPPQTFEEHWLEFSAVEKFFYKREHELSSEAFLSKLKNYDPDKALEKMDKSTLKKILAPLLSLRQACSHPNTTRGRYLATKKQVTSMQDLLDALILKNTSESEESLRLVVAAHNGLAGIYLLMQQPERAVDHYRIVLQLTARFSEDKEVKLALDKLQVIHAMHNLAEILEKQIKVAPTLRDETLRADCFDLEQKYIGKFMNQTANAYDENMAIFNTISKLQSKFLLNEGQWYSDGVNWVFINSHYEELLGKIETAATNTNIKNPTRALNNRQLLMSTCAWDEDVSNFRADLYESISKLYEHSSEKYKIIIRQQLVAEAMDCHLRPQQNKSKNKKRCLVCVANENLKKYEGKLFNMTKRKASDEEMGLIGSWTPTIEELTLKSLLVVLKSKNADPNLVKDGETHISIIDSFKKEFKEIRKFWTYLDQQICAQDELDICKIRLQLKQPETNPQQKQKNNINKALRHLDYKIVNKLETVNMLSVHELDYQKSDLHLEEVVNMALLEKKLGTQSYLETLRKQQFQGQSPDPCPICKNPLENHWSILPCGHCYCLECIQLLLEKTLGEKIQCSVCRNKQKVVDISYIKAGQSVTETDCTSIKGNYSTKIEAVVKLVMDLKAKEPSVKVLLFSSWINVLKCIKQAMEKNGITADLAVQNNLEGRIEKFKSSEIQITALLLPINLGSKGLNLIEATHVVLVEPLLNPADELQAIGRVHRIGQTKETVVHKFLIKNTIEESIFQSTTSNAESWDKNKVTLRQLMDLFGSPMDVSVEASADDAIMTPIVEAE